MKNINEHRRIIVIGPGGAGKSYFSKQLANITGFPLYHLDNIFWNEDRTHISREEFDKKLLEILEKDSWIIDGDYSRTYEIRIKYADTIYFLDFPLEVALEGVESRIGKPREDIPWKEDIFDPEFRQWIIDWYKDKLPWVYHLIDKYKGSKNIIVFKSRDEMNSYIDELRDDQYYKTLDSLCGCLKDADTGEDYKSIVGDEIIKKSSNN